MLYHGYFLRYILIINIVFIKLNISLKQNYLNYTTLVFSILCGLRNYYNIGTTYTKIN